MSAIWVLVGAAVGLVVGYALASAWWRARVAAAEARASAVTQTALAEAREQLVRLVTDEFRKTYELSRSQEAARLGERKEALEQAVRNLVDPVREQLHAYEEQLRSLEAGHQQRQGELRERLEQLARANSELLEQARQLATALRAPAVRGRWGEQQLRRIVELAGMLEHCDFDEQVTVGSASDASLRPDLVVHLPGGRKVVVDAKTPLDAFLAALDADDEEARREHLERHAKQVRKHVDDLSRRDYSHEVEGSIDFVVAFVPGDPLLQAAYEQDPGIFEHALRQGVLLATPITLVALLRAVAYSWQQDAVARNAREVLHHGRELYRRLCTMSRHLASLGGSIDGVVKQYNKLVGSIERSVLPGARHLSKLGVVGPGEEELTAPPELTAHPRNVSSAELTSPDHELPLAPGIEAEPNRDALA
jgi:DNA recombination protein RmuC